MVLRSSIKAAAVAAVLVIFSVCHTLFMRMQLPAYGPRIGTYLDDISYAMLVALCLGLVFCLPSMARKVALLCFIVAIQVMMIAQWWHFEFYRDYIHYSSLGYIANLEEGLRGFKGFENRYLALGGSLALLLGAFLMEKKLSAFITPAGRRLAVVALLCLGAAIPTSVFTWYYYQTQINNWQRSVAIPLNYKNPVMQMAREKFIDRTGMANIDSRNVAAVDSLYNKRNGNYPFFTRADAGRPDKARNVLYITLESVREYETLPKDGIDLTPNLNRIARDNFTPRYYYANSNQTIKAEIALMCGTHDFLIGTSISAGNNQKVKTNCLPGILKEYGYTSYWFHGAKSDFFNRETFLPKIGFDQLHDREVIENDYIQKGKDYSLRHWGVEDPYTFDYALETLENAEQPFFAEILKVSNHHPFIDLDINWTKSDFDPQLPFNLEDTYNRFQHLVHYTDRALGRFWQQFRQSDLYDNTVVVISGDHGIWLFDEGIEDYPGDKTAFQYESYLRLPLTIYFPDKTFEAPVDATLSQVDVPGIIMTYLGLDYPSAFQTRFDTAGIHRLLDQAPLPDDFTNPVFTSIGDNFYYRNGNIACYPPIQTRENCDDYLFRCVEQYNVLDTDKQCVSWQGDMLTEIPQTHAVEMDIEPLNLTVDYFRKALFFGSLPEQNILGANLP